MEVKVVELEPLSVVGMRHVGPYWPMESTWDKLIGWAKDKGLNPVECRLIAVFHDDPKLVPPEELRSDACLTVGPDVVADGEVQNLTIAGGLYTAAVDQSGFSTLAATWAELRDDWIPSSEFQVREGACLEEYPDFGSSLPFEERRAIISVPVRPR